MKGTAPLVVFVVGPQPPPIHGVSTVNSRMAEVLGTRHQVIVENTTPAWRRGPGLYHVLKLCRVAAACLSILKRRSASKVVYIAVDGGFGALYSCLLTATARASGASLFLHHHSFAYISRPHRIFGLLNLCAGPEACHIFLCEQMLDGYRRAYGAIGSSIVVSNAIFVEGPAPSRGSNTPPKRPITIGLMSNLSIDKGPFEFIQLVRHCRALGLPIRAVLAGPSGDPKINAAIAAACCEFGEAFEYRGAVFGERKHDFFESIDVFVFPTTYRFEAQPVVLFEALSFGCTVISMARGCICEDFAGLEEVLVLEVQDFVAWAAERLVQIANSPGEISAIAINARCSFDRLKEKAERQFTNLLARFSATD